LHKPKATSWLTACRQSRLTMGYFLSCAAPGCASRGATMFARIQRSFDLVRATARVLRQDNHLLLFPAISAVAMVLVVLGFALPVFGVEPVDVDQHGKLVYSLVFLFYVVQYVVIIYFNTALVGAAMIRMDGGSPTLGDGLRIANSRLPA